MPDGEPHCAPGLPFANPHVGWATSPCLPITRGTARMEIMLADAASIIAIILLLAAAGGFLGILLRHKSGSGCGCCCERLNCPPKPPDDPSPKHANDSSTPQQAGTAAGESERVE